MDFKTFINVSNKDKDIYDLQDYVLHHVKYTGLYQLQIIMDWMSFDNPDEDCFIRWVQNNYTNDCNFQQLCDNCIMVAEEHLYKVLGAGSQEVFFENPVYESLEDDALEGKISTWDREKINNGKTPIWAKSVKTNEPKPRKVAGSMDYAEQAMRKVTDPYRMKEPARESDWQKDNEDRKALNEMIAEKLSYFLSNDCDVTYSKNGVKVIKNDFSFNIESCGPYYKVFGINKNNVLDKKFLKSESLVDVAEFIEEC